MVDKQHLAKLKQGANIWNVWAKEQGECFRANLEDADLFEVDLHGANLINADLKGANLIKADLGEADLKGANLSDTRLLGTEFVGAILNDANLSGVDLRHVKNLKTAVLHDTNLQSANLGRVTARTSDSIGAERYLRGTDLSGAELGGANLSGADLSGINLSGADLSGANLSRAKLGGANLTTAVLKQANLKETLFDNKTQLSGADVHECQIDRLSLEVLVDYGGLDTAQRAKMKIVDGVADLRASFSGFQMWVHIFSLVVFVAPYAWFISVLWGKSRFIGEQNATGIPLWEALARFIFNGGNNLEKGFVFHSSFLLFIYLFSYNILRAILLWKTKKLEFQQEITGRIVLLSLDPDWKWKLDDSDSQLVFGGWGFWFRVSKWAFWVSLVFVFFNTLHFFNRQIPGSLIS